jgi:hypothetical protein
MLEAVDEDGQWSVAAPVVGQRHRRCGHAVEAFGTDERFVRSVAGRVGL